MPKYGLGATKKRQPFEAQGKPGPDRSRGKLAALQNVVMLPEEYCSNDCIENQGKFRAVKVGHSKDRSL